MQKFNVFRGNRKLGVQFGFASDDSKLTKAKAKATERFGGGVFLRPADA